MASKLLSVAVLSCLALLVQAAPSPEETALRNAITSTGAATYFLTKNIVLSANLPPLADEKVLRVESANIAGAPFQIDGKNKYTMFKNAQDAVVSLTLAKLILTRSKDAAVNIGGDGVVLSVNSVNFLNNARALNLYLVNAQIANSNFIGHTKSAIVTRSEEGSVDDVGLSMCKFAKNKAESGQPGGAIRVLDFASITADKCTFQSNSAGTVGGAVSISRGFGDIRRSVFDSNTAKQSGGGLSLLFSAARVLDTSFKNNVAERLEGGALQIVGVRNYVDASKTVFGSVVFEKNKAVKKAGGAFVITGTTQTNVEFCKPVFSRNTGVGAPSNGWVVGALNALATDPATTIPLVAAPGGAPVTFLKTATCTY
eukprot:TRINITY_DN19352_c0_g1_i1.p1 TRINITY_DN19352_c0_g1~~TRINITY_DN19352_c0_g1_i1.p1  ORF type:complete len:370 (+),score=54.18 TRINITY_DN19352_c0_g1_i1:73-1182(+)